MIKRTGFCGSAVLTIVFTVLLLLPASTAAQFVDLTLDIEPKLEARTERNLDFGILESNAGRRTVALGDPDMGIFSITALENQVLLVDLNLPTALTHEDRNVDDIIPVDLHMRYGFSINNPGASSILAGSSGTIMIEESDTPGPWSNIYLFIYGSLELGDIVEGSYSEDIVLYVEYM